MIDLTPLINAIIAIMAAIALRYLVPWINSKTTSEQRKNMLAWVEIAVAAAQQLYHEADGSARLTYALSVLEAQGFDIEEETILDAVEAAVLKLHAGLEAEK